MPSVIEDYASRLPNDVELVSMGAVGHSGVSPGVPPEDVVAFFEEQVYRRQAYSDSPSNGATLILRDDTQAEDAFIPGSVRGSFPSDVKVGPGSKQRGCIPFEVKRNGRPKTFQFTPDSGFAQDTGEWRLN